MSFETVRDEINAKETPLKKMLREYSPEHIVQALIEIKEESAQLWDAFLENGKAQWAVDINNDYATIFKKTLKDIEDYDS